MTATRRYGALYVPPATSVGMVEHERRIHEDAAAGSAMLRESLHTMFRRAERRHGLSQGDGVHLLLNNGRRGL
jgi:hypothetical protein